MCKTPCRSNYFQINIANYQNHFRAVCFIREEETNVRRTRAAINVEAMPNDLCCKQPNLVWYNPLVQLGQRKVGYTLKAAYSGHLVGDNWERYGENSAFYGSFAF